MSARMTIPEAVSYLTKRDRGCKVVGDTIYVYHRQKEIGILRGERGHTHYRIDRTVASLSVAKLSETEAAN